MKLRVIVTGSCALSMVLTGCEGSNPDEKEGRELESALAGLAREPHRSDVEVDVFVSGNPFKGPVMMSAEMRGSHRHNPGTAASDLDLPSVTTTIDRTHNPDLVRKGAVRVVTVNGRSYVRNTLRSGGWRTLPDAPEAVGTRGYDPASAGRMLNTTMIAEMFRDQWPPTREPDRETVGGEPMEVYGIDCAPSRDCLEKTPEIRALARKAFPSPDLPVTAKLWWMGAPAPGSWRSSTSSWRVIGAPMCCRSSSPPRSRCTSTARRNRSARPPADPGRRYSNRSGCSRTIWSCSGW